jgi:hypothetical protein
MVDKDHPMTHYYSPHTGEHINTNTPADWMSSTALPVPSYDPTTSSAIFTNGAWSVVQAPPADSVIPPKVTEVTMRQARLALLGAGLLDDVDAALNAIPNEAQRKAALIEWEFSNTVQRDMSLVQQLAPALGLSEQQLDNLFAQAAQL